MNGPFEELAIDLATPFGKAFFAARAAFDRRDVRHMNVQYRYAAQLASAGPPGRRTAVAGEHVTRLRTLNDSTTALARCEEYLVGDEKNVWLRLLRAETDLVRGDHSRTDDDLAEIRRIAEEQLAERVERITDERFEQWVEALLSRLEGLAAAWHGRFSDALACLDRARRCYSELAAVEAVAVVDEDSRAVRVRQGTIVPDAPPTAATATPQARLIRSEELRLAGRYEEALRELQPVLDGPLDPALRYHVLDAAVRLLRLLGEAGEADKLKPALEKAADASARPAENRDAARRLDREITAESRMPAGPDRRLQHIRRLVLAGGLAEAQRLLLAEHAPAQPSARHAAEWHLAAGELALEIVRHGGGRAVAEEAVAHFDASARHAAVNSLVAIRVPALRMLGHAHAVLDEMDRAVEAWATAHKLEETVAALQPTDSVRIRYLQGAADEFDERVRVADHRIELGNKAAVAAVVVAMEAARGAAILSRILPGQQPLVRDLPRPSDIAGAVRWVHEVARTLPRSQVVWMLHATPTHLHHALVGNEALRHASVRCDRKELIESIKALTSCWTPRDRATESGGEILESALTTMKPGSTVSILDARLGEVASRLGLGELDELPDHVTRIAVVAGGELSEIPFAVLPCPGSDHTLIGRRYALSDLPCLSVRGLLARRSRPQRGTRGTRMLLLSPVESSDGGRDGASRR